MESEWGKIKLVCRKCLDADLFVFLAGNLVNVVIPRPSPDGEQGPDVGKVGIVLFFTFSHAVVIGVHELE